MPYHYLPAVKADLLGRQGRTPDAAYRHAIALTGNDAERARLNSRLDDAWRGARGPGRLRVGHAASRADQPPRS